MACPDDLARRILHCLKDPFRPSTLSPYFTYSYTRLHSIQKFTQEHREKMNINASGFLWLDEEKLVLFLTRPKKKA